MKVHVVMGNDFPAAVFSTEEKAAQFIESMKVFNKKIYWRAFEFELDQGKSQ